MPIESERQGCLFLWCTIHLDTSENLSSQMCKNQFILKFFSLCRRLKQVNTWRKRDIYISKKWSKNSVMLKLIWKYQYELIHFYNDIYYFCSLPRSRLPSEATLSNQILALIQLSIGKTQWWVLGEMVDSRCGVEKGIKWAWNI